MARCWICLFKCWSPSICNLVIDKRTGNLKTNGSISTSSITSGPISTSGDINSSSTTASTSSTTGSLVLAGGAGIAGNVYFGANINTSNVTLNSQKKYSLTTLTSVTNFLGNNNLSEFYIFTVENCAAYLPQSSSTGIKLTFRRAFVGTLLCDIYSYNSVANTLVLNGQTSSTNYLSIAASTGITSVSFVYYSGMWYQI